MSDDSFDARSGGATVQHDDDTAAARGVLDGLRATLRDATLDVIWRQWRALGGMVTGDQAATSVVDPEALVLISLVFVTSEPRLADILIDWVSRNSDLLSVQRIRNLTVRYPAELRTRLRAIAQVAVTEGKDHRWNSMLRDEPKGDTSALQHRGNKARAGRVQATAPTALVLRLRLAFGVGIKADVLAFLLGVTGSGEGSGRASVSAIAGATDYTVAAVRKSLDDLVEAGLIDEVAGTRAEYGVRAANWRALLQTQALARWRGWNARFQFVAAFTEWATRANQRTITPYIVESLGRELIKAHAAAFPEQFARRWTLPLLEADGGMLLPPIRALADRMRKEA